MCNFLINSCSATRPFLPFSFIIRLKSRGGLLLWQRGKSEVWLNDTEFGEQGLGLLVLDAGVDNHIITRDPVDWGGDTMLVAGLEGVNDTENLGGVAASGSWVGEDEADGLLGVDDEDRADGERNALGVNVGGILVVKHVIEVCDFAFLVTNDRERELGARDLIDILDPSSVRLDGVGGQTDQLDATLGELRLKLCESAELGGADGGVIFRVREENDPFVANELMEVDWAGSGLSLEVWRDGSETERHFAGREGVALNSE